MRNANPSDAIPAGHRTLQKERIAAAWRRLQQMYARTDGPDIFAAYKPWIFTR